MNNDSIAVLRAMNEASKKCILRWPAIISLAAALVLFFNLVLDGNKGLTLGNVHLYMLDAVIIFGIILMSTYPVCAYTLFQVMRQRTAPSKARQLMASALLLVLVTLLAPSFSIEYREFNTYGEGDWKDDSITVTKRTVDESMDMPVLFIDQLTWLQSNFSAAYIPAKVYCPRRSARLYPMLAIVRETHDANALSGDKPPPAEVLARTIARCERDGPAMRAAGHTKEGELMKGNVDRFFAYNAWERTRYSSDTNTAIVLEDSEIPALVRARVDAFLDKAVADDANALAEHAYVEDSNYANRPGQVRRLNAIALAAALGRTQDVERIRASKD